MSGSRLAGRAHLVGLFYGWTSFIKPHPPCNPPVPWHRLYHPKDAPTPAKSRDELAWLLYHLRLAAFRQFMDEFPDYNRLAVMWTYYYSSISFIDSWTPPAWTPLRTASARTASACSHRPATTRPPATC